MFKNIPKITENLIVNKNIKDKYNKYQSKDKKDTNVSQKSLDDLCPICLDDLENGEEIDFCKNSCGKSIHKICFSMWCKTKKAECVFCRQPWEKTKVEEDYINLIM